MMMNDTTFLLDENLDAQEDITDLVKWAAQSQERQTSRARELSQNERQCMSYPTLARETWVIFYRIQAI